MKHSRVLVGLMSVALILGLSVAVRGQKAAKAPPSTTTQQPIPLKVTVAAFDDLGNATALRGHPGAGDITYWDRLDGADVYVDRYRNLWFHLNCQRYPAQHIDLDFVESNHVVVGKNEPFQYAEGDMNTFRIVTWAPQDGLHFGDLKAGDHYTNFPMLIQFWTDVDQYSWSLQYDGLPRQTGSSKNSVDVTVTSNANGGRIWTVTPTQTPRHLTDLPALMLFEKYVHQKPHPADFLDYGTWMMPFKLVFEELPR